MAAYPLHIALQEGFTGDSVTIAINGQEVLRKQDVKTRLQTGYADAVEVQVPAGAVAVQIDVLSRQTAATQTLQVTQPVYLGVSLTAEGSITSRVSHEPFRYL
jgi:hypothetical protein